MTRISTPFQLIASIALALCLVTVVPMSASATTCQINGAITAELTNDPGFEGLYKYTVTFTWDTDQGLSHTSIFLALANCECVCEPNLFSFGSPAGSSLGELPNGEECTALYEGSYVCMGDPTIPEAMNSPAIKFDAIGDPEGCEPGKTGVGIACFYSPLPPGPINSAPNAIGVKAAGQTCLGPVDGFLPMCDCSVQIETSTWGEVKGSYR